MMVRTLLVLAGLCLLVSPALASDATADPKTSLAAVGWCSAGGDGGTLADQPEPTPQAPSICIGPGQSVTCSAADCHTNCTGDASCSPNLSQYFTVYQNAQLYTYCCNYNGNIGPYPQCRGSRQWWMAAVGSYKVCGCA